MTISQALFSSDKEDWETPDDLFEQLDREFCFDLDAAALEGNAKCSHFLTKEENALKCPWYNAAMSVNNIWLNPPYGDGLKDWLAKCWEESNRGGTIVVLLPARTDTIWFHEYVYGRAEVRFLRGRLRFKGAPSSAPFPSMLAIFRPPYSRKGV